MARLPRLSLAGFPHFIMQRGNNGQPIFSSLTDYQMLLSLLTDSSHRFKVDINAYVLMPSHFHLLATPQTTDGLSLMMQAIGRSYVRWFNNQHHRTGTLWDGRYKSTVIDADKDLLDIMVYMDSNPVRAGLTEQAADHVWSSYACYIGHGVRHDLDKQLVPHPSYWGLGNTPFAREIKYAELVKVGIGATRVTQLTDVVLKGWVQGNTTFVTRVQALTSRRVMKRPAGRPMLKKCN